MATCFSMKEIILSIQDTSESVKIYISLLSWFHNSKLLSDIGIKKYDILLNSKNPRDYQNAMVETDDLNDIGELFERECFHRWYRDALQTKNFDVSGLTNKFEEMKQKLPKNQQEILEPVDESFNQQNMIQLDDNNISDIIDNLKNNDNVWRLLEKWLVQLNSTNIVYSRIVISQIYQFTNIISYQISDADIEFIALTVANMYKKLRHKQWSVSEAAYLVKVVLLMMLSQAHRGREYIQKVYFTVSNIIFHAVVSDDVKFLMRRAFYDTLHNDELFKMSIRDSKCSLFQAALALCYIFLTTSDIVYDKTSINVKENIDLSHIITITVFKK